MRLTLNELDVIIGLLGDVDWHAHFNDLLTKENEREFAVAERVLEKLYKRYWVLKGGD